MAETNDTSNFVVDTIMSHVKDADESAQKTATEDVITKLVSFYEERLFRQKEEIKDEFLRLLSKSKPTLSDGEAQCAPVEAVSDSTASEVSSDKPASSQVEKHTSSSEISDDKPVSTEADSLTSGNEEIIEVDIRPASGRVPQLSLVGDFVNTSSSSQSNDAPGSAEEGNAAPQQPQSLPVDVNSHVLMMMMNVLGGGAVPVFSSDQLLVNPHEAAENDDEKDDDTMLEESDINHQPEKDTTEPVKVESPPVKETAKSIESVRLSEEGNFRPNTGASMATDYDPENPSYLRPPSPKVDAIKTDSRVSHRRGDTDHMSPSASTASMRVQLYEKHQKQIADLKAYYEEELEDLRAKLRQVEERTLPASMMTNSRYTNTSPSPKKSAPAGTSNTTDLERECASLRLKVEWLDQAYKNTTLRLKDAETQVDELATKLSAYSLRVADSQAEIEDLHNECRAKDDEIGRLMARNNRLLVEVEEAGRMLQIKDQSLAESDAMLNRLMREYSSMNKEYENLKAKHESSDNALQDSKQELANAKRQINKMSFEFRRLEHENDLLTKRLQLTTSFNVAERFSTPPVSTATSSYQAPPLSAREYREPRPAQPAAGLASSDVHADGNYRRGHHSKVSFGAPYATTQDDSDSTDVERELMANLQKVNFRDQSTQIRHEEEPPSAVLRAERELFANRERPVISTSSVAQKKNTTPVKSPRKPSQLPSSASTNFQGNGSQYHSNAAPSNAAPSASSLEQQFDKLLVEKQRVEASLNRLPAAPSNQTIRANKELLERQLDEIERRLSSLRFHLKKSQVIRSSLN